MECKECSKELTMEKTLHTNGYYLYATCECGNGFYIGPFATIKEWDLAFKHPEYLADKKEKK